MIYLALAALALGTYAVKALGPLLAAGLELPDGLKTLANLLPAALLAALVAHQTVALGVTLSLDARVVGLGLAAVAVALRAPFAVVVLVGAVGTALTRMLGWG